MSWSLGVPSNRSTYFSRRPSFSKPVLVDSALHVHLMIEATSKNRKKMELVTTAGHDDGRFVAHAHWHCGMVIFDLCKNKTFTDKNGGGIDQSFS